MDKKLNPHPDIPLDLPTGERIAAAVAHYGAQAVEQKAAKLLRGENAGKDFLLYAGGRHGLGILDGAPALYWPELWGARTLLFVWDDSVMPDVLAGLQNRSWRVREMCLRVVLERDLPALSDVVALTNDENPRVRAAALRALAAQGSEEHHAVIAQHFSDRDKTVRPVAQQARDTLTARLAAS
ncbi:HEAT repeat domain-containing protein [Sanguibacter sp. HDW7]|uniref:HEAT repeat domain-containing protein n=1 Tax=Sanguibacter sp. HDW7 TaxID=2714931 RepID=UPI00140871D4|nr:HEAT repeat domain-containing protein [Sanguibacter sp. HDW7]QIK84477.1 HEAT repeat domain-containing protein [Sanguibacter sp. HDW7]